MWTLLVQQRHTVQLDQFTQLLILWLSFVDIEAFEERLDFCIIFAVLAEEPFGDLLEICKRWQFIGNLIIVVKLEDGHLAAI